jgi:hypothetical protein
LLHITRGFPHWRKLREIMDHLYALFDRRCRTHTALDKRKKLRQWVNRFTWIGDTVTKVFAPTLEKALTFLDETLLPATSNAVERGNRRHRKMQKSVYRVRSQVSLDSSRFIIKVVADEYPPVWGPKKGIRRCEKPSHRPINGELVRTVTGHPLFFVHSDGCRGVSPTDC